MKNCVIIVTYEPEKKNLRRLTECAQRAGFTPVIVDNSLKNMVKADEVSRDSRIVTLGRNAGIAAAQNQGIYFARREGAEVIGFFDQDSSADEALLKTLLEFVLQNKGCVAAPVAVDQETGAEYPVQRLKKNGYPYDLYVKDGKEPQRADLVISSGMMTTSEVLSKVGDYDEDFFIDFVDIEWCFRCKKQQIPIYVLPEAVLFHKIGERKIDLETMEVTVHSPVRTYYKVRNAFLLLRKKVPAVFCMRQILPAVVHNFLLLFYVKEKKKYLKYYVLGILHGICGVRGEYRKR